MKQRSPDAWRTNTSLLAQTSGAVWRGIETLAWYQTCQTIAFVNGSYTLPPIEPVL